MYRVRNIGGIGDLSGGLAGQDWPGIPPGWVPSGTPGLPGVPAPVPGPPRPATTETAIDGPALVAVSLVSIALTVGGVLAWRKWGPR